jgi:hypothetical protein
MVTKEFRNALAASFIRNVIGGTPIMSDNENRRYIYELPDTKENREWCKMYRIGIEK